MLLSFSGGGGVEECCICFYRVVYRVGWFIVGLLNAKLPLGRHCYMTVLRSQEVGGGGTTPNAAVTVTTRIISALRWAAE